MERERIVRRIADDTGGGQLPQYKTDTEFNPVAPQTFSSSENQAMARCHVDYAAADKRWHESYERHVSEEARRFLVSFARFIPSHDYRDEYQLHIVRCVDFYGWYFSGRDHSVSSNAMSARIVEYRKADFLSHGIHRGAHYMWFEKLQKKKLIAAATFDHLRIDPNLGAKPISIEEKPYPEVNGRPLSGPEK